VDYRKKRIDLCGFVNLYKMVNLIGTELPFVESGLAAQAGQNKRNGFTQ